MSVLLRGTLQKRDAKSVYTGLCGRPELQRYSEMYGTVAVWARMESTSVCVCTGVWQFAKERKPHSVFEYEASCASVHSAALFT
jgi:hypothetical protein